MNTVSAISSGLNLVVQNENGASRFEETEGGCSSFSQILFLPNLGTPTFHMYIMNLYGPGQPKMHTTYMYCTRGQGGQVPCLQHFKRKIKNGTQYCTYMYMYIATLTTHKVGVCTSSSRFLAMLISVSKLSKDFGFYWRKKKNNYDNRMKEAEEIM